MLEHHTVVRRRTSLLPALAAVLLAATTRAQTPGPEYEELDSIQGSFVNLATFPIRPMLYDPSFNLWVINHHDSTIQKFVSTGSTPTATYAVPWGPVSMAYWENDVDPENTHGELVVVCRASWCVARLDIATGEILSVLQFRPGDPTDTRIGAMAEPADILVDAAENRAFVSCPGADSVIQIDLASNAIERVYRESDANYSAFRSKSPTFLSWGPGEGTVLVAPLISGNDTIVEEGTGPFTNATRVDDLHALHASSPSSYTELPDEDLFEIDPSSGTYGTVTMRLNRTGTILFAHGINPATGDFWQLNTEALNGKSGAQSEPDFQGAFAKNRVTIVDDPWGTPTTTTIGLDPGDTSITTSNNVAQPFALAFHHVSTSTHYGKAFIAGLISDNVVVLNPDGSFYKSWDLPAGSMPRAILMDRTASHALVYCWGDNKVRMYTWNSSTTPLSPLVTYDVGFDPTPQDVQDGRKLFFSAAHSRDGNLGCSTCHVEGGTDFLAWNLSNLPQDDKGPMVTQTMTGLERLGPFHWRGERDLKDFNGAFEGLLGGTKLSTTSGGELDDFQSFVFSLRNPANPFQNRERILDATIHDPQSVSTASALDGQDTFRNDPIFHRVDSRFTCNECHQMPTGTDNDIFMDRSNSPIPSRNHFKPTPFIEEWRKRQSTVSITYAGGARTTAFLGTGTGHSGVVPGLFEFAGLIIPDSRLDDVADFIGQWDQGLAPAVHFVFRVDGTTQSQSDFTTEVDTYLMDEALKRDCDVAVIGRAWNGTTSAIETLRWFWDRQSTAISGYTGAFLCEKTDATNFPPRTAADFATEAAAHSTVSHVFVGLPVGMAERWAVDYDLDKTLNKDESSGQQYTFNAPSDTTNPGWGTTGLAPFPWKTTNMARLLFDTNEPTNVVVSYIEQGASGSPMTVTSGPTRNHSVLLTGLRPSTTTGSPDPSKFGSEAVVYDVTIEAWDVNGNGPSTRTTTVQTDGFLEPTTGFEPDPAAGSGGTPPYDPNDRVLLEKHVVDSIDMPTLTSGGVATVDFGIAYQRGPRTSGARPPADLRVVVGRPMIRRWSTSTSTLGPVELIAATDITPGSDCAAYTVVKVTDGTLDRTLAFADVGSGTYLVTKTASGGGSFSAGATQLHFTVSGLNTHDVVIFDVDAVVEVTSQSALNSAFVSGSTISLPTETREGFDGWDFPSTKEARSSASKEF